MGMSILKSKVLSCVPAIGPCVENQVRLRMIQKEVDPDALHSYLRSMTVAHEEAHLRKGERRSKTPQEGVKQSSLTARDLLFSKDCELLLHDHTCRQLNASS
ncbi:hypothetical protein WAI453_002491 [Rhynchosporium graminicola]